MSRRSLLLVSAFGAGATVLFVARKPPSRVAHDEQLVVTITGASRGLGRAMAVRHLQAGDKVVACGRSDAGAELARFVEEAGAPSENLEYVRCDVTDARQVEALMRVGPERWGRQDLVVLNAGFMQEPLLPLLDTSAEQLSSTVDVNAKGALLCLREALRVMRSQTKSPAVGQGSVVLVGGAGSRGFRTQSYAAYGYLKNGLGQLVDSVTHELLEDGLEVRVNVVDPGLTLTDMVTGGPRTPEFRDLVNSVGRSPARTSAEMVAVTRGLASTGQVLHLQSVPGLLWSILKNRMGLNENQFYDEQGRCVFRDTPAHYRD